MSGRFNSSSLSLWLVILILSEGIFSSRGAISRESLKSYIETSENGSLTLFLLKTWIYFISFTGTSFSSVWIGSCHFSNIVESRKLKLTSSGAGGGFLSIHSIDIFFESFESTKKLLNLS